MGADRGQGPRCAPQWWPYRLHVVPRLLTMPARIGDFDLSKPAVAVLNVLVDDYAEVWINGQMPRRSGYPSPATIQGLNMPNRVVLGTEVKAGDRFQLAVFAINGPMCDPFGSIWFRQAMVEFYR